MKILFVLLCCILSASAASFDRLVVFGDSLSDTGNFRVSNPVLFPGRLYDYANGRFTDGAFTVPATRRYFGVWHEQLAGLLSMKPANASKMGGLDYAYGDATTVDTDESIDLADGVSAEIQNLGSQVRGFLSTHAPRKTDLIIVWAGANDVLDGTITPEEAVANIDINLRRLISAGGRVFVVPNLPPLGDNPEAELAGSAFAAALNLVTVEFNAALANDLNVLAEEYKNRGVALQLVRPNIYRKFQQLERHPAAYGLKNIHSSAQGKGVNPDVYLYWDPLHPTTKGHNVLAKYVASLLGGV